LIASVDPFEMHIWQYCQIKGPDCVPGLKVRRCCCLNTDL
jgi:hypothetical protein